MSRLKNSIIALAVLVILVGVLAALKPLIGLGQVGPGPAPSPPSFGRPGNFYLTKTTHDGAQALTACAAGYHMASLWEIYEPSNLRYSTVFGFTLADSGLGPPNRFGWIRTGVTAENTDAGGYVANCLAWTSAEASDIGCSVGLQLGPTDSQQIINPWKHSCDSCNTKRRVWCVQD